MDSGLTDTAGTAVRRCLSGYTRSRRASLGCPSSLAWDIGGPLPPVRHCVHRLNDRRAHNQSLNPTRCARGLAMRETAQGEMELMKKTKLLQMHNVGIVVDDLKAAIAFFAELGLELEGETTVEGQWVDRIVGLNGVRSDIAMMRTPDGHSRLELTKFQRPTATSVELNAPVNTLGIRRIMFAVEDIKEVLTRLQAHGAELVGEIVQYEDLYLLCYVRGPEGILIALAEPLR